MINPKRSEKHPPFPNLKPKLVPVDKWKHLNKSVGSDDFPRVDIHNLFMTPLFVKDVTDRKWRISINYFYLFFSLPWRFLFCKVIKHLNVLFVKISCILYILFYFVYLPNIPRDTEEIHFSISIFLLMPVFVSMSSKILASISLERFCGYTPWCWDLNVHGFMYLPTPSHEQNLTNGQFFSEV